MAASSVPAPLTIERCRSTELTDMLAAAVHTLCDAAYGTATKPLFASLGPGEHLLGLRNGALVSHLMWVTRWLQPAGQRAIRTAYVEMGGHRAIGAATGLRKRAPRALCAAAR